MKQFSGAMRRAACLALAAAAVVGSAASAQSGRDGYALAVSGEAPMVCRATLDNAMLPASGSEIALGTLAEFCNSPNGYRVYVDASPELAGATLVVDGKAVTLAGQGPTLVSSSSHPAAVSRDVTLRLPQARANGTLSFHATPL